MHSEYSKNLQNENWREYQVEKLLISEDHPCSRFSKVPNKESNRK